jgi:hypothetical protein
LRESIDVAASHGPLYGPLYGYMAPTNYVTIWRNNMAGANVFGDACKTTREEAGH